MSLFLILNKINFWFNQEIIFNNIREDINKELQLISFKKCSFLKEHWYSSNKICFLLNNKGMNLVKYEILDIIYLDNNYSTKIHMIIKDKKWKKHELFNSSDLEYLDGKWITTLWLD
jgi:hypothetical protein